MRCPSGRRTFFFVSTFLLCASYRPAPVGLRDYTLITQAYSKRHPRLRRMARRLMRRMIDERVRQTAASFSSPVRIRMTRSTSVTKILPSPILPVRAAPMIASMT